MEYGFLMGFLQGMIGLIWVSRPGWVIHDREGFQIRERWVWRQLPLSISI
jgi:hypothetical protein